jgi:hypothetical protein
MAVQVWVLGHLLVLDPTGVGSGSFLNPRVESTHDPHRTGFRCGFCFSPTGAPKTQKTSKKHETQKNPKRNLKNPDRNLKKS